MSGPSRTACCTSTRSGEITPTIVTGTLLSSTTLPMTSGSPPNRLRQKRALITATGGAVGWSSSGTIVRPGLARESEHAIVVAGRDEGVRDIGLAVDDDVHAAVRRARERGRPSCGCRRRTAGTSDRRTCCGRSGRRRPSPRSRSRWSRSPCRCLPAHFSRTSESGSATASFFRNKPLTALNSAVLAPMPSASDSTTTAVQPLSRSSVRAP